MNKDVLLKWLDKKVDEAIKNEKDETLDGESRLIAEGEAGAYLVVRECVKQKWFDKAPCLVCVDSRSMINGVQLGTMPFCPNCGRDLRGEVKHPCKICELADKEGYVDCPNCGRKLR